jgi:polysaccharide export outer membrane protein
MTVLDVVLAAGGLGQFAAGNRAKIVRIENGKQVEIRVKLVRLVEKGDLRQNLPLRPGDVLVVPQALF